MERIAALSLVSNEPAAVLAYAKSVLDALGYDGWGVALDNAKKRCGACHHGKRKVTLSRHYLSMNEPDLIRNTVLHEVAHVIAGPGKGHGPVWRHAARTLGIVPKRCNTAAKMPKGKWSAPCGCPGKVYTRHKAPLAGRRWWCRLCRVDLNWVKG